MEKRCTIKTIARHLGVSPSTVSRAFQPNSRISDSQRDLILKTARELNYVPNQAASRLKQKAVHIAVLIHDSYPAGRDQLLLGIEEAYRSFSDYKVDYEVEFFDNKKDNPAYFSEFFRKLSDYDGLILAGIGSSYVMKELEAFRASGKAVVLLQSGPDYDGYLFRSVPDAEAAAGMAAEFLSVCTAGLSRRRVVLFTGRQTLYAHLRGKTAFLSACEELGLEVNGVFDMQDDEVTLSEISRTILTPEYLAETDGIYITSGVSLPLCRYLEEMGVGDRIFLVTTDAFPELHPYILRRTVNASIYQNFYKQAWNAYEYLVKHLISDAEPPKYLSPHPEFVLRSNIAYYDCP